MSDLVAELKGALSHNDAARIKHFREIGLALVAKWPGSLSEQALDYLARACVYGRDECGLDIIAEELPGEVMPRNANLSLREMAHLQMVRGYVYRRRKTPPTRNVVFKP